MKGIILWMLATPAAAGDVPPVMHYEVVANPRPAPAQTEGEVHQLAMTPDPGDRMTVPVRLGNSGPFQFLVDTGSNRTSVSRELVQSLGLAEGNSATLHSSAGRTEVRLAHLPELHISRRSVRDIKAPVLHAANMGADGILGIDALRSQRVLFDFAGGRLSIQSNAPPLEPKDGAIVVVAKRREGRLVVTNARVDGVRVSVVLDTGSVLTVGNAELRRKLERRGKVVPTGNIDLISVTGRSIRGENVVVGNLEIGGARLEGLGVVFADAHTFRQLKLDRKPALLLGMNALHAFDQVAIDFADRTLSLVLPRSRRRA